MIPNSGAQDTLIIFAYAKLDRVYKFDQVKIVLVKELTHNAKYDDL